MFEDNDREILAQLKKKKKSFKDIVNKKSMDMFELESAMREDY